MDFNALVEDMRIASTNLRKESNNRKGLSTVYCSKTCKAIDKTASLNTDYENVITGLWVIAAHLIEQIDHLTQVPGIQEVAIRLFRECAKAVLNIQWQNLEEDSSLRQNFLISLANLNAKLVNCNFHRFRLLESLTENPWTDPTLAKIMGGGAEDEEEKEEVRKYIENEDPIILQLRVDMMLKENCEEYALNLCNSCLTHPDLKSDLKLHKTQLTLLHKLGHTDRLQEECQKLSTQEALMIIRQLQTKANREICTVLAQTFMVQNWIRPSDQEANKELLKLWIKQQVRVDKEQDRFKESAWAIAKLSQSTEQIIFFIDVLREQCGGTYLQLYVDMCIFAINVDKGQMETSLRQGNLESAIARKSDMAAICGKLACLVHHDSVKVARMCVLTAFSLMPSEETYESIGKFYDKEHNCCGNCTKNANADPGTVNPATLYEVERLLNMLRPDYLSPESNLTGVQTLCKRYLQERVNSKNIFSTVPVSSTQVEGPGKKKGNSSDSKVHNLFDAVSPHELSNSQVLLSKLRLQQIQSRNIKNVIYSQPPQPASFSVTSPSHGWPNILQTGPKRTGNSTDVSNEQLGNIVKIDKQFPGNVKASYSLAGQVKHGQQIQLLTPSQRSLLQQQSKSQVRLPQPSSSNAPRQQQTTLPEQINLIKQPNAGRNNSASVTQRLNQQVKETAPGVLNITRDKQFKMNTEAPQKTFSVHPTSLNLSQSNKAGSQQPGTHRLPTVSTLLKPSQNLELQRFAIKSSLPPSFSYQSNLSRKESPSHQTTQVKNSNVNTLESQKQVSTQPLKFQTEHLRNLMQATALNLQSQQKQQVFSKQMAGAVVTVNQQAQGPLNTNLPKNRAQTGTPIGIAPQTSAANFHAKLSPRASILHQLQQHGRQDAELLLQRQFGQASSYQQNQFLGSSSRNQLQSVVSMMKSSTDSMPFQPQTNTAISSGAVTQSESLSSQNQTAVPSDELSGSIMGIDDTIIKELLQDSGIFSNTFPDIEVEDINKKQQEGAHAKEVSVVSSRMYSPSRQSASKLLMASNPQISDAFSVRNNTTILNTKKISASVSTPSLDSKQTSSLLQYTTLPKFEYKAPHADTNTLNQRQFPEDLKPCLNLNLTVSPPARDSGSNLSIVEQLREKMRKEQIEGEVTMDSSNNATYRCIICSLAFGELEELREHVRNVCKPGLQSSSVYNNKIEQDRAKSAKAGLETTTVFQCLRCFELCISDAGIKQHRLTCKRVPTVPPDIKNATLKGKTSPSASSSRSSTPKTPVLKKEVKDNSNKPPDMPLPLPCPSLNTKSVLESLSVATAKSQASLKPVTTKTEASKSPVHGKDLAQTSENSTKKVKAKPLPSPSYSEISGSGGSKFYRCKVCSQTLCSMESLYSHWKECFAKHQSVESKEVHKTFVYEDELEPGEIRPLFGRVLENVVNIITSVAHGQAGDTDDFDSDAELSDYESLLDLKDPCRISQISIKPFFLTETASVHPSIFCANLQNTQQGTGNLISEPESTSVHRKSHVKNEDKISNKVSDSSPISEESSNKSKNGEGLDQHSFRKGDESEDSEDEEDNLDSNKGTHLKLRDRNSLKPIQSFINESFVSPYSKVGLKGSGRRKSMKDQEAAETSTHSEESEEENHICVACKKRCPSERILIQHYAGKHLQPYTTKSLADTTSFFCHLCQKTFTTFKHYMLHVPNHRAVIFQKMNHLSPRRGTASPWSRRLASSRGFISRQHSAKKGKISPKLASALKSKKKAAKSARDRLRRCLSKKSSIRPSPLSLVEEGSSSSSPLLTRSRRSLSMGATEQPVLRNHLARRCQSFIHSLPQSENDDSCPSSNPACSDEDYTASEDIDSDSSPSVPPCTRNRKRSGQNPDSSDDNKRKRCFLTPGGPSLSEAKDKNLLPVVSVRRISEQEIEKYSKGPDPQSHSGEASIDPHLPMSTASFQASFESYLRNSMDLLDKSKSKRKMPSSSPAKSPMEFSAQEESNGSFDHISQTDTESSTVSYATDLSHESEIKEDEETKEILSSLTKRRCSVNLGEKLNVDTIQTLSETKMDEKHHKSSNDDKQIQKIQSSLPSCAVRLERTQLADKLLESVKEGVNTPTITDSDGLGLEKVEVVSNTELNAVQNQIIQEITLVSLEHVKESPEAHSEGVTKPEENSRGKSDVQLTSWLSTGSCISDDSVLASAELETDKVHGISESLSEIPNFSDLKNTEDNVEFKPDTILSDSQAETLSSVENETNKELRIESNANEPDRRTKITDENAYFKPDTILSDSLAETVSTMENEAIKELQVESVTVDVNLEGPISVNESGGLLIEKSKDLTSEGTVQDNTWANVSDVKEEMVSDNESLINPKEESEMPLVDRNSTALKSLEVPRSVETQDENRVAGTQTQVKDQTSSAVENDIIKTGHQVDLVRDVSSPSVAADSEQCTDSVLEFQEGEPACLRQPDDESLQESLSNKRDIELTDSTVTARTVNNVANFHDAETEQKAEENMSNNTQGEISVSSNSENTNSLGTHFIQTGGQALEVEDINLISHSGIPENSISVISEKKAPENSKPFMQNTDNLSFTEDTHQIQSPANEETEAPEDQTSVSTEQKSDDIISNNESYQSPVAIITSNENASETRMKANVCPNQEASEIQTFVNLRSNEEASEMQALSIGSSEEAVDVQLSGSVNSNEVLAKPSSRKSTSNKEPSEIDSWDFNKFTVTQKSENISAVATEIAQELPAHETATVSDNGEEELEIMSKKYVDSLHEDVDFKEESLFITEVLSKESKEEATLLKEDFTETLDMTEYTKESKGEATLLKEDLTETLDMTEYTKESKGEATLLKEDLTETLDMTEYTKESKGEATLLKEDLTETLDMTEYTKESKGEATLLNEDLTETLDMTKHTKESKEATLITENLPKTLDMTEHSKKDKEEVKLITEDSPKSLDMTEHTQKDKEEVKLITEDSPKSLDMTEHIHKDKEEVKHITEDSPKTLDVTEHTKEYKEEATFITEDLPKTLDMTEHTNPEINSLSDIHCDDKEKEVKDGVVMTKMCPLEEDIDNGSKNTPDVSSTSVEVSPLPGQKDQNGAAFVHNGNDSESVGFLPYPFHKDLEMVASDVTLSVGDEASKVKDKENKDEIMESSFSCFDSNGRHPDEVSEIGSNAVQTATSQTWAKLETNDSIPERDEGKYTETSPSLTNNSNAFIHAEVEEEFEHQLASLSNPVGPELTDENMDQSINAQDCESLAAEDNCSDKELKTVQGQETETGKNSLIISEKDSQNNDLMEEESRIHKSNSEMALHSEVIEGCGELPQGLGTGTTFDRPSQEDIVIGDRPSQEDIVADTLSAPNAVPENRLDKKIEHSCPFPETQQEEATDSDALFEPIEDIDLLPTNIQLYPEPARLGKLIEIWNTPSGTNDTCHSPEKLQNRSLECDSDEAKVEPQMATNHAEQGRNSEEAIEEENLIINKVLQNLESDVIKIQSRTGEQLEKVQKGRDRKTVKDLSSPHDTFPSSSMSKSSNDLLGEGENKESTEVREVLKDFETVLEQNSPGTTSDAIGNSHQNNVISQGDEDPAEEESVMKADQIDKMDLLSSVVLGESACTTINKEDFLKVEMENSSQADGADPKNSHNLDEDDLSDYDLVIEEDTSYNRNVFNQTLMAKDLSNEESNKSVSVSSKRKTNSVSDQEGISPTKQQYQKLSSGLKSLKEKLKPHRFEWDDFDEDLLLKEKEMRIPSAENRRLLERKQNALKSKSESSPFMWDLEDSPEKQEHPCFENDALDSDIRKSLNFENFDEKASNVSALVTNKKPPKRGRKSKMVHNSNTANKEGPATKTRLSSTVNEKSDAAKVRKHAKSASSVTSPALVEVASTRTGVRQRHRSSESPSLKNKPTEELSQLPSDVIPSASNLIVDDEISFNTKSYSPIPPEVPKMKAVETKRTPNETQKRGRKRSKKMESSNPSINATTTPKGTAVMSDEKRGKPSSQNSVVSESSSLKRQERDLTPSSEAKRAKLSGQTKSVDPLSPKLKKAGLIRVAKHPSLSTPSPSSDKNNVLPFTRSSEAALKAFNQKSLRNREVQPTTEQSISSSSRTPQQKRSQENLKQNKNSMSHSPSATPSSRSLAGQGNNAATQVSRKIARQAGDRNEMPTAAIVKRRTPSLPRKSGKEIFPSNSKRKQSATSTTIYRVDPLPKEASSKAVTSSAKGHGTVHTPLPPGVSITSVNPKKKQAKAKWKIDKEMKPTKVKSKQHRSPISFRKT